jgi:hypothetical protein
MWPPAPPGSLLWVDDNTDRQSKRSHDYTSTASSTSHEAWPTSSHRGMLIAGIGGSASLLSFLALPYFSIPLPGEMTMPSAISLLSRLEPKFSFLWSMPAIALYIVEAYLLLRTSTTIRRSTGIWLTVLVRNLSLLGRVGYFALIALPSQIDNHPITSQSVALNLSLLRIGYFIGLSGMLAAFIGSTLESRKLKPPKCPKN